MDPERLARLEEELLFCIADDVESTSLVLGMLNHGDDEEPLFRFEESEDQRALVHSCLTSLVLRGYIEVLEVRQENGPPGRLVPTEPPPEDDKDLDYWWGLTKRGNDFVLDYLRSVEALEGPAESEEAAGPGRRGYEHRVLMTLHRDLILRPSEWTVPRGGRIEVEQVRHHLSEHPEENRIEVFVRDAQRPGCLFGCRFDAVEPVSPLLVEDPSGSGRYVYASDGVFGENRERFSPEGYAEVIRANLKELIFAEDLGLPEDCKEEGVTWI